MTRWRGKLKLNCGEKIFTGFGFNPESENIETLLHDMCCTYSLSPAWLCATPWTVAHQAPLSMGFSRQEYWRGLPFPPPGDLSDPGIELTSHFSCIGRRVLYHYLYLGSFLVCHSFTVFSSVCYNFWGVCFCLTFILLVFQEGVEISVFIALWLALIFKFLSIFFSFFLRSLSNFIIIIFYRQWQFALVVFIE